MEPVIMNTLRVFYLCCLATIMTLLLAQPTSAQRPSIADLQAQIDALQVPLDSPAAQVRTALNILPEFQEAVARYFWVEGEVPANRTEAGMTATSTDTSTNYITAVAIVNGTIVVTFGNYADASIVAKSMTFTPYESVDLTISWRCGAAPFPFWFNLLGTAGGGQAAAYIAPTIPASTYPDPCIMTPQPASHNDVIRAQVRNSLDILPVFQEAVAKSYGELGEAPVNRAAAGLTHISTDTQTQFISEVEIVNGTIIVTFGNNANPLIDGKVMTFTPYESIDQTVVWRCGSDSAPSNAGLLGTFGGGTTATYVAPTILPMHQPEPCILRSQPGSQDEIIRAQVLEAFDVVATLQDAVEAAGAALGSPSQPVAPSNRTEAGLTAVGTDTVGLYFHSVDIWNGTITVTYGNEANSVIAYETLSWTPYESVDGTIVWRCGAAPFPAGTQLMGTSAFSTTAVYVAPSSGMLSKYLPHHCRP